MTPSTKHLISLSNYKFFTPFLISSLLVGCWLIEPKKRHQWSEKDLALLDSMQIIHIGKISDSGNAYVNKHSAALLGKKIFFSKRLSKNKGVSCATCHKPSHYFSSGNRTDGQRNTPTVVGAVTSPWQFWDGRSDSLWAQSLVPFESDDEHGLTRTEVVDIVITYFKPSFIEAFGAIDEIAWFEEHRNQLPKNASPHPSADDSRLVAWSQLSAEQQQKINRLFSYIGKAVSAYQAKLIPAPTRFDKYVSAILNQDVDHANSLLSEGEEQGLKLFISDKGKCARCHNGPMLTNHGFTATATPQSSKDFGRSTAVTTMKNHEFSCLSEFSDSEVSQCDKLTYLKTEGDELRHAFKVPSLRNVTLTAPYMHNGSLSTLHDVLEYYNRAPRNSLTHTELEPLYLWPYQLNQLEQFLSVLESEIAAPPQWLHPPQENSE